VLSVDEYTLKQFSSRRADFKVVNQTLNAEGSICFIIQ